MRDIRLFVDVPLTEGDSIELPEAAARHAVTVLRLKIGDLIVLFNGQGGEYRACLQSANRRQVQMEIIEFIPADRESALHTRLVQALGKGDRTEWAIRKAVELGVSEIVPLLTERTQVKLTQQKSDQREGRWRKLIIAACEQSGRTRIPPLRSAVTLGDRVAGDSDTERIILDPRASECLQVAPAVTKVELLVGPEGGFTDQEYQLASHSGYRPARLGPRVLRTETAPLAALALLQAQAGDWGS
ncbi:MAG: 16S rRNA (uracil(1498)-N(3))-methyltransferase [Gammaproteobacteria bacterium]